MLPRTVSEMQRLMKEGGLEPEVSVDLSATGTPALACSYLSHVAEPFGGSVVFVCSTLPQIERRYRWPYTEDSYFVSRGASAPR